MRSFLKPLLVVGVFAAIGSAWFLSTYERVEESVKVPPSSRLRTNAFVVAERFLHHMGASVRTIPALTQWPAKAEGTVIVWLIPTGEKAPVPGGAEQWVRRGGHLVWGTAAPAVGDDEARWLSDAVSGMTTGGATSRTRVAGSGRLTWLADPARWRNKTAMDGDHLARLWAILNEPPAQRVLLVVWPASPSLFALLWTRAWQAVLAALALIVAWLWRGTVRLGPLVGVAPPIRRRMTEHVRAAGVLLWRTWSIDGALARSRQRLRTRLAVAFPRATEDNEAEWLREIAEKSGFSLETVAAALSAPVTDRRALIRCMKAQQALEEATR